MEPLQNISIARFGTYEVSFPSGQVRKAGMKIKVQPLPLKLLEILLEYPGEVVTRDELRNRLWPTESFGDFDQAVNIAIGKLRSAFGDSAENPQFIETIPKRGYRFIAEVSVVDVEAHPKQSGRSVDDLSNKDPEHKALSGAAPNSIKHVHFAPRWVFLGIIFVLVVSTLAVWQFRSHSRWVVGVQSLAVLPLENLSGDSSQDYFADGMTDQLITDLAQISALRVISRTSTMAYKGSHKPLPQIARELHVNAVVEGTVQRSGNRVRITAQLIDGSSDQHLWAESYEENERDTLALQKKVATAIAENIRIQLTPQEKAGLQKADVVKPEAYESYLKGRFFWNKRTPDGLKVALAYFQQAIEEDPKYAHAYAGLADSYDLLGDWEYGVLAPREAYPKAKDAAIKALELDSTLGEAHTSLAFSLDVFDWDWDSAEREFRKAIELNPSYATAHHWFAWHLSEMGRNSEAIAEMRKAENLDPLSLIISAEMAEILLVAHRYDEAMEQSRKTIAMDSNFAIAHLELGHAFVQRHMYNEAIAELQKAVDLSGGSTTCRSHLAYAYAVSGRKEKALTILNDLKKRSKQNAPEMALIYVGLGDRDQAMKWLEQAYVERFNPSILLRPAFDPLRSDPRFQDLVHRFGFHSLAPLSWQEKPDQHLNLPAMFPM